MDPRANKLWRALSAVCLLVGLADAGQESMKIVRAGANGARARNFQDPQGLIVRQIPAGELLRVHGEDVGFLDVEVQGGLQVWVFGEFLEKEPVDGDVEVFRVTTSRVNMRPRPGASTANMPIRTKLNLGDRVRLIERADLSKPLAEDWVKVWSPRSSRAWVRSTETEMVPDAVGAAALWNRTVPVLPSVARVDRAPVTPQVKSTPLNSTPQVAASTPATTLDDVGSQVPMETKPSGSGPGAGAAELAEADRLYDAVRHEAMGDFGPVVAAYERALKAATPGSTNAEFAARRVQEAQVRRSHIDLKQQIASEAVARDAKQDELHRAGEARELANTPNWGRFDTRGWITRREARGGDQYTIEWRGDVIAEVVCSSGRYDLSIFDGFEIGVVGRTLEEARISADRLMGFPMVLDVESLEVISGSGLRRAH